MQSLTDSILWNLGTVTSGGAHRPLAVLRCTTGQTVTSGATGIAVPFDTEDADSDAAHSTITNPTRWTAQSAGWADVTGHAGLTTPAASAGAASAWFAINGTEVPASRIRVPCSTACPVSIGIERPLFFNVGDYVELWVNQLSGASLTTQTGTGDQCALFVEWRSN